MLKRYAMGLSVILLSSVAQATDYNYKSISSRNADVELEVEAVKRARMEGECLVGLNQLLTDRKDGMGWAGERAVTLLEQFTPCHVLIMMEVAQARLGKE